MFLSFSHDYKNYKLLNKADNHVEELSIDSLFSQHI